MYYSIVLPLLDIIALLAYAVVLSSYERRCMAMLHMRDAPTCWGALGLLQPLADGGKLLLKAWVTPAVGDSILTGIMLAALVSASMLVGCANAPCSTAYYALCHVAWIHIAIFLLTHSTIEIWLAAQQGSKYAILAMGRLLHVFYGVEVLWVVLFSTCMLSGVVLSADTIYIHCTASLGIAALPSMLLLLCISMLECSLHPYDILECEPEIVSGYYVDHGAVAFMLLYLAEGILMVSLLLSIYTASISTIACIPIVASIVVWVLMACILMLRYMSCRWRLADVLTTTCRVLCLDVVLTATAVSVFFFF
uniref:NADH-ubiquinone oxidoreductase chain 1 n=1 Tax=Diplonema ambulator TaxID=182243 RepID=A0A2D2AJR9_9EUGL|nr:NADH dehydrogenase subunit 1 [Diplonema ambulator]